MSSTLGPLTKLTEWVVRTRSAAPEPDTSTPWSSTRAAADAVSPEGVVKTALTPTRMAWHWSAVVMTSVEAYWYSE